jgi:hypothetical protein
VREIFPAIWMRPLIIWAFKPLPSYIMIGKFPVLQYILPESKKEGGFSSFCGNLDLRKISLISDSGVAVTIYACVYHG